MIDAAALAAILAEATGLPIASRKYPHVRLDRELGAATVQRAGLEARDGRVMLAVWPGELKDQALALYRGTRAVAAVREASAAGWLVEPRPHLGFFMASRGQRLHLTSRVDSPTYARQWSEGDVGRVGGWRPERLRPDLWPWLLERGYASPGDEAGLDRFIRLAGRRGPHLRPAMRFAREWGAVEAMDLDRAGSLAPEVCRRVDEVLEALGEPPLPGRNAKSPPERALRRSG